MATIPVRIFPRRGTAAQWASSNPVLASGEIGVTTDTSTMFIGDGVAAYAALPKYPANLSSGDFEMSGDWTFSGEVTVTGSLVLNQFDATGVLVQTGPSSFVGRTITGDANIAVTNGSGVDGNPTVTPQGNLAALLTSFANIQTVARSLNIVALGSDSPTPNMAEGFQFSRTWTGNGTVANPTNAGAGMSIALYITQDATGGRTVGFGSNWIFRGTPTIDPAPDSVTMVVGSFLTPTYIIARIV